MRDMRSLLAEVGGRMGKSHEQMEPFAEFLEESGYGDVSSVAAATVEELTSALVRFPSRLAVELASAAADWKRARPTAQITPEKDEAKLTPPGQPSLAGTAARVLAVASPSRRRKPSQAQIPMEMLDRPCASPRPHKAVGPAAAEVAVGLKAPGHPKGGAAKVLQSKVADRKGNNELCDSTSTAIEVKQSDEGKEEVLQEALAKKCRDAGIEDLRNGGRGFRIAKIEERAITLPQLEALLKHMCRRCKLEQWSSSNPSDPSALQPDTVNLYDIVYHIVKPVTKSDKVSYVEFVASGPQVPAWFVSHWWGEPVARFVACLMQHRRDRKLKEASPYWVCAYARNPWQESSDISGDPSESAFRKAIRLSEGTVSVLDAKAECYTRLWCGYEVLISLLAAYDEKSKPCYLYDMYTTVGGGTGVDMKAVGILDGQAQAGKKEDQAAAQAKWSRERDFPMQLARRALQFRVQEAKASLEGDRRHILNAIAQQPLDSMPMEKSEHYDKANNRLRGRFALDTWRIALESGIVDMRAHGSALRASGLDLVTASFVKCAAFGRDALQLFVASLPHTLKSLCLNLSGQDEVLSGKGLVQLNDGLGRLTKLNRLELFLGRCKLGDEGAALLGEAVGRMSGLTSLSLHMEANDMSTKGAVRLCEGVFRLARLTRLGLDLSMNKLEAEGATGLGEALGRLTKLNTLLLCASCTRLGAKGVARLCEGVGRMAGLKSLMLTLTATRLGAGGTRRLGDAVGQLAGLTWLYLGLSIAGLGDDGAAELSEAMGRLEALTSLHLELRDNGLGAEGVACLGEGMGRLKELTSLGLDLRGCNDIGTKSLRAFQEQLQGLTHLKTSNIQTGKAP